MRFSAEVAGRRVRVEVHAEKGRHVVTVDGRGLDLDVCHTGRSFLSVLVDGRSYDVGLEKTAAGFMVRLRGVTIPVTLAEGTAVVAAKAACGPARIVSPMPGKIVRVLVTPGQVIEPGAPLVVVEAMKMENELRATRAGTVVRVHARDGQAVDGGALLVELE
jgi:glutaconyl-CoA/methylmalonyl-CoA decarboxylase subunit gamma